MQNPFRYFNSSPEVIRSTVMLYVRFPLSLRQVEDLLYERGHRHLLRNGAVLVEPLWSVVFFGDPQTPHSSWIYSLWRWHLDEVFVRINGRHIIYGALSITKAKFLRFWPRNGGIAGLRLSF